MQRIKLKKLHAIQTNQWKSLCRLLLKKTNRCHKNNKAQLTLSLDEKKLDGIPQGQNQLQEIGFLKGDGSVQ